MIALPSKLILPLSLTVAILSATATSAAVPETVPVGVAKVDITPETPVRMYGYAARKTESEGIAGRLHAAALALGGDQGEGPAVLLTVDCGAVVPRIRNEVLRRVQAKVTLRPERFMLCNSHNHSGPDLKGMDSLTGVERRHLADYAAELTDRLEKVVLRALESRTPSHLAWTQGRVGFAANRRLLKDGKWVGFGAVPGAPVDHDLPLLRVTDTDGKLRALVVNYACHNTTLRGNFRQIHGDWAACAQKYIETDHPGAVALVTIGCGADSDPCPHSTVELCEQHGRALADEVKRLVAGPFLPIRFELTAQTISLEIPCDPLPKIDEIQQLARKSHAARRLLRAIESGETPPKSKSFQIATWAFSDDLAMVFLSDEVVADYALRLKRELDGKRLWISAYTNDVSGYIVSKRILKEGGYEANNSLSARVSYGRPEQVQPALEDRIIGQVRSLLPAAFHAADSTAADTP